MPRRVRQLRVPPPRVPSAEQLRAVAAVMEANRYTILAGAGVGLAAASARNPAIGQTIGYGASRFVVGFLKGLASGLAPDVTFPTKVLAPRFGVPGAPVAAGPGPRVPALPAPVSRGPWDVYRYGQRVREAREQEVM